MANADYEDWQKPLQFEKEILEFTSKFLHGANEFQAEYSLLKISVATFLAISLLAFFLTGAPMGKDDTADARLPFLFYSIFSSVLVVAAIANYRYRMPVPSCMEGMMIGMTIGMVAGFMFGASIGATNGMFVGSVFGMAIGMASGAYCGKFCGIMGVMEGLMAGLMGGTMGAMLSVMMINDNLMQFMAVLSASCTAIVLCMAYMVVSTTPKRSSVGAGTFGFRGFFFLCSLLSAFSFLVIYYAPRSGIAV